MKVLKVFKASENRSGFSSCRGEEEASASQNGPVVFACLTNSIHPNTMQQSGFSNALKVGPPDHGIDPLLHDRRHVQLFGHLHRQATQTFVIAAGHGRETRPKSATSKE